MAYEYRMIQDSKLADLYATVCSTIPAGHVEKIEKDRGMWQCLYIQEVEG